MRQSGFEREVYFAELVAMALPMVDEFAREHRASIDDSASIKGQYILAICTNQEVIDVLARHPPAEQAFDLCTNEAKAKAAVRKDVRQPDAAENRLEVFGRNL